MAGAAPLSFATIEAWARLMDVGYIDPLEIEALLLLDAALITVDEPEQDDQVILPTSGPQWPSPKTPKEG